jgi:hypothetical protein
LNPEHWFGLCHVTFSGMGYVGPVAGIVTVVQ